MSGVSSADSLQGPNRLWYRPLQLDEVPSACPGLCSVLVMEVGVWGRRGSGRPQRE